MNFNLEKPIQKKQDDPRGRLVFDMEKELQEIKGNYHGEEGLNKVKELKEKWLLRKKHLVELQDIVLENIYNAPEDFSATGFLEKNKDFLDKINFSSIDRGKLKSVLILCEARIYRIKSFKEKCVLENGEIDDKKMFNLVFRFDPEGEIKCKVEPFFIYFKTSNNNDFSKILSGDFLKNEDKPKTIIEKIEDYGAVKLDKVWNKELSGGVAVESPSFFCNEKTSLESFKHERNHSLNHIILNAIPSDQDFGAKKLEKLNSNNDPELERFDFMGNSYIEKLAKDEILTYFVDGKYPKNISKILLKKKTLYEYGFFYNPSKTEGKFMHPEYFEVVQNGIIAMSNLLKAGYNLKEVQNFLVVEPLLLWPKVSDRIIGQVRDARKRERDIKDNISKVVLKKKYDKKGPRSRVKVI